MRHTCTTKLVSRAIKFKTTATKATLTRGKTVFATGTVRRGRVLLDARRRLRSGRYALTLRPKRNGRRATRREPVMIG